MSSTADVLRKYGAAKDTHAKQWDASIIWAQSLDVEIIHRSGGLNYRPGNSPGSPGQLILDEDASFGALLHEMRHLRDDQNEGWLGASGWFSDPYFRMEAEVRAYHEELRHAMEIEDEASMRELIECVAVEYRRVLLGDLL